MNPNNLLHSAVASDAVPKRKRSSPRFKTVTFGSLRKGAAFMLGKKLCVKSSFISYETTPGSFSLLPPWEKVKIARNNCPEYTGTTGSRVFLGGVPETNASIMPEAGTLPYTLHVNTGRPDGGEVPGTETTGPSS